MIHLMMPFRADMNYGRALNDAMGLIPEGDWLAALDHDAMFTTRLWHSQIEEAMRPWSAPTASSRTRRASAGS